MLESVDFRGTQREWGTKLPSGAKLEEGRRLVSNFAEGVRAEFEAIGRCVAEECECLCQRDTKVIRGRRANSQGLERFERGVDGRRCR